MLVRAVSAGVVCARDPRGTRNPRRIGEERDILPLGDSDAERADCGGRSSRGMGDCSVRNSECRLGGSASMGHKYIATVLSLALP